MHLSAYLTFDGNCETAFKFYEQALGGKIEAMMPYGETPACDHVPSSHHDKIMHARLIAGNSALMGSDAIPDHPFEGVKGCSIAIAVDDPTKAEKIFAALSKDGSVMMPMQETFWATRFGMATDKFGVPWMVNCEKKA